MSHLVVAFHVEGTVAHATVEVTVKVRDPLNSMKSIEFNAQLATSLKYSKTLTSQEAAAPTKTTTRRRSGRNCTPENRMDLAIQRL